ncbi:MAG: alpha/beta hydrolase [Betaproteobacteria bacterium]
MKQTEILIVPGWGNSGPGHWQSIIENRLTGTLRVEQAWEDTSLEAWSCNIDRAARALDHPPLVVAHSFGCLATAHALMALGTPIAATLFVAPANPQRFDLPTRLFSKPLRQSGLMIASENDPWLTLEKAETMASDWGIECINIGAAGHINVASGYGAWPYAENIIKLMRAEVDRPQPKYQLPRLGRYRQDSHAV